MYCVDGQARNLKRYLIKSNSLPQVKEEKLFIFIIKLQILSYQGREFHKFFWAINCCHGFYKIFAFRKNIFAFDRPPPYPMHKKISNIFLQLLGWKSEEF